MEPLKKTVTVQVAVDWRIADLVYFVKSMAARHGEKLSSLSDEDLVAAAESFWDTRHGED
jgi:hypothetical protein